MRAGRQAAVWVLATIAVAVGACGGTPASGRAAVPVTGAAAPETPQASSSGTAITLAVAGAHRPSRDVVQVDVIARNTAAAPVDLAAAFSRDGGLAAAFLLAGDGRARLFVLSGADGAPHCSAPSGELAPGAQQSLFVRFPALSASPHTVTLVVPGVGAVSGVQVPAAEAD